VRGVGGKKKGARKEGEGRGRGMINYRKGREKNSERGERCGAGRKKGASKG